MYIVSSYSIKIVMREDIICTLESKAKIYLSCINKNHVIGGSREV